MPHPGVIVLGETVPHFEAPATGAPFKLADHEGTVVVLYFYPKDNTPGCTTQGAQFRDNYTRFLKAGTVVYGISRDSMKSHDNFKAKLDLPFDLIVDEDEKLCTMFDVIRVKHMYGKEVRGIERSTFVIDGAGKLVKEWRGVKVPGHVNEVLTFVKSL